jgi:hypothetical protein
MTEIVGFGETVRVGGRQWVVFVAFAHGHYLKACMRVDEEEVGWLIDAIEVSECISSFYVGSAETPASVGIQNSGQLSIPAESTRVTLLLTAQIKTTAVETVARSTALYLVKVSSSRSDVCSIGNRSSD